MSNNELFLKINKFASNNDVLIKIQFNVFNVELMMQKGLNIISEKINTFELEESKIDLIDFYLNKMLEELNK